ncbi:phage distal tail protein [Streptomyces sp. 3211]|uniref:phage distal tail protein n=1 Tax=Streptomyces sp. 3211 TaxID=1964449 RepID=UPI0009A4CC61|nr:phage tail domain-containing protein [Streptomyces sp. 3211]
MAPGDRLTSPGQVQYGDLLLGAGTYYRWKELAGWESLPPLDSGTVLRAGGHGAYPGTLYAQARTITAAPMFIRAPSAQIGEAVRVLGAGTGVVQDEQPLAVWLDERGPLLTYARIVRRSVPVGIGYRQGVISGVALQWEATDARRYGIQEQEATAGLPQAEDGLSWNLDPGPEHLAYPLAFGLPGSTGTLVTFNGGDADTHPVVTFRGPVSRPSLTNITTGLILEYDITLAAEDRLTVDTANGTVMLNGQASRLYTVTPQSCPEEAFTLAPGSTPLVFRAEPGTGGPAASVSVRYRAAYW